MHVVNDIRSETLSFCYIFSIIRIEFVISVSHWLCLNRWFGTPP